MTHSSCRSGNGHCIERSQCTLYCVVIEAASALDVSRARAGTLLVVQLDGCFENRQVSRCPGCLCHERSSRASYVQAKRYTDTPVDRPQIHGFAGALLSKQGDRGVFITTSRFTKGASEEADRINARIELIDGARLAELLVQYGIGVQPEQSVMLYRLDEDFFDSL